MAGILGEDKCNALIGLHAVTGCDNTGKMFKKKQEIMGKGVSCIQHGSCNFA